MREVFDTPEAAEYLHLSPPTLERFRHVGDGPAFCKLTSGRRGAVRYRRCDLDVWLAARVVRSTSEVMA